MYKKVFRKENVEKTTVKNGYGIRRKNSTCKGLLYGYMAVIEEGKKTVDKRAKSCSKKLWYKRSTSDCNGCMVMFKKIYMFDTMDTWRRSRGGDDNLHVGKIEMTVIENIFVRVARTFNSI